MKIRPVGAELFHADGQTDMTKLIVAFRNFTKAPKNSLMLSLCPSVTLYQRLMFAGFSWIPVLRSSLQNKSADQRSGGIYWRPYMNICPNFKICRPIWKKFGTEYFILWVWWQSIRESPILHLGLQRISGRIFHTVCPVWAKLGTSDQHMMPFKMCRFDEHRCNFLTGVNEIIFTCNVKSFGILHVWRNTAVWVSLKSSKTNFIVASSTGGKLKFRLILVFEGLNNFELSKGRWLFTRRHGITSLKSCTVRYCSPDDRPRNLFSLSGMYWT